MRPRRSWLEPNEREALTRIARSLPAETCDLPGMLAAQRLVRYSMFLIQYGLTAPPLRCRPYESSSPSLPDAATLEYRLHALFGE